MPCAGAGVGGQDRAWVEEGVGRHAEDPLWQSELSFHWRHGLIAVTVATIEVPPAGAVGDEIERAVRRLLRLEDRLIGTARDQIGGADHAVLANLADPQLRAIPRHVGMVPLQPS